MDDTQDSQALAAQLASLASEAKKIGEEVDETLALARKDLDGIDASVDESVVNLQHAQSELDEAEKKAGDELDALALEQAEDLAGDIEQV